MRIYMNAQNLQNSTSRHYLLIYSNTRIPMQNNIHINARIYALRIYALRIYALKIYALRIYALRIYDLRIYALRIYALRIYML